MSLKTNNPHTEGREKQMSHVLDRKPAKNTTIISIVRSYEMETLRSKEKTLKQLGEIRRRIGFFPSISTCTGALMMCMVLARANHEVLAVSATWRAKNSSHSDTGCS